MDLNPYMISKIYQNKATINLFPKLVPFYFFNIHLALFYFKCVAPCKFPKTRTGEPESGVFGSLEPEPIEKKTVARAAWKKSQEPEPLKN